MRIIKVVDRSSLLAIQRAVMRDDIHSIRFSDDGGGIKIKVNGGTWSPPMGTVEVDD